MSFSQENNMLELSKLGSVRDADVAHDAKLTVIAARGNKTLKELRSLGSFDFDSFIVFHRDGGPWETKGN